MISADQRPVTTSTVNGQSPLLSGGLAGPHIEQCREHYRRVVRDCVLPHAAAAERARIFPVPALRDLGTSGVFAERWEGGAHGDLGRCVLLCEELGRLGYGGVALGVSLHSEAMISVLRRFGTSSAAAELLSSSMLGATVGCVAMSEHGGGSDLMSSSTSARPVAGGWRVVGQKAFVSLGSVADFAVMLARVDDGTQDVERAAVPLVMLVVPKEEWTVRRQRHGVGVHSLDTVELEVDGFVPDELVLGRPGAGLLVAEWALAHERFAVTAGLLGTATTALRLAVSYAERRRQFGSRLIDHQALRLRLTALDAELDALRNSLLAVAAIGARPSGFTARRVAGMKVLAARLAETVASEAMQTFGGLGYLEEETPLARIWRDVRLARIGGGADDVLLEFAATGLRGDDGLYSDFMGTGP